MYSKGPYSSVPYSSLEYPATSGTPFPPQTTWPNPVRRKPAVVTQLTWTDSFKLPLQQTLPPHQTDWPAPTGPKRGIDLITWTNPALFTVPPEIPNIMQYDWPNPKGPVRALDLLTWLQPLTPPALLFVPTRGLNQYDWPNPRAPRRGNPDWVAGSTWVITQAPPVISSARNRDWPNPRGARRSASFLQLATLVRPTEPTPASTPQDMLANQTGRVRFLKNEVRKTRFLAKNPNV
jgi:hypothetical protein